MGRIGGWTGCGGFGLVVVQPFCDPMAIEEGCQEECDKPQTEGWFEFSDKGFTVTGVSGSSSFHPWPNVLSATDYPDGILFSMDEPGFTYYWVPKISFPSQADYTELLSKAASGVPKPLKRGR